MGYEVERKINIIGSGSHRAYNGVDNISGSRSVGSGNKGDCPDSDIGIAGDTGYEYTGSRTDQ